MLLAFWSLLIQGDKKKLTVTTGGRSGTSGLPTMWLLESVPRDYSKGALRELIWVPS